MINRKKAGCGLLTVAFAAAPIGALAGPVVNTPQPTCNSSDQLAEITWSSGSHVGMADTVLGVTVPNLGGAGSGKSTSIPFDCNPGWDLTTVKSASFVETKGGNPDGGATISNIFASAEISGARYFSIDFGPIKPNEESKYTPKFIPTLSAFDYQIPVTGSSAESGAGAGKVGQQWVTDFNLNLGGANPLTGAVAFQDYLGVQVISGASALSVKDTFFINDGKLIFDPSISGPTTVNLLSSPDPHPVPEPATFALMAAGLLGMALVRRRKRRDSDGIAGSDDVGSEA